jgi:hypothetical protein
MRTYPEQTMARCRLILIAPLVALAAGCSLAQQQATVDIARAAEINSGTTVQQPPASSIFPTNGVKWYTLEIGNGKPVMTGGKRTWLVELRGWLSAVGTECNTNDPDWHYMLEIDPDWADSARMPLAELLRAGNFVANVTAEQTGDTKARTSVGIPNVNVELNGYIPAAQGGAAAPPGWSAFGKNCVAKNETTAWEFDPAQPLSWQSALQMGDYVRMYGALVTDGPHTEQGFPALFFCNQFNIGAACSTTGTEQRLALIRWAGNRPDNDPTNSARWTELHPPDIIAVLPAKPHTTAFRSVAVSAENCLIGPCETTTLDVDIAPPQPKPATATGVAFREEVVGSTNYRTITDGHPSGAGGFDGATVTVNQTGIHVHVAVQGQAGYGAHGRFAAFYRVKWTP